MVFNGSRNSNYAQECLNVIAHMKHGWSTEFMDAFSQFCLVNPSGLKGRFHPLDRFNEHKIRKLKAMIRPSSNPESDEFFCRTVAFNFTSLASVKAKVQHATRSTNYKDQHQAVDAAKDLQTLFRTLMVDGVFKELFD